MHKSEVLNAVAENISSKLWAAETSLDETTVRTAQLLEAMVSGRMELNMASPQADVAQARVAETVAALAEARRAVTAAHSALEALRRKNGVVVGAGGPDKDAGTIPAEGKLRIAG